MTNTNNNIVILDKTATDIAFEGSNLIDMNGNPISTTSDITVQGTFKDLADTVGGAGTSHANFDANMFKNRVRTSFIDGIGPDLTQLTSLDAVLELSGLNFNVIRTEARYNINDGVKGMPPKYVKIPDQYAIIREDTREPLGVVGKNFNVLQNREAFDFLEGLSLEGMKYETASTYGRNGAKSFICMSTEGFDILGDAFKPYLVFLNGFDGSQTVQAFFTSVRIFCQNCINRALKDAQNKVSIRHSNQLKSRLEIAQDILLRNSNYLHALKDEGEKIAIVKFSENQFYDWASKHFASTDSDTPTRIRRNDIMIDMLMTAYHQPDLDNFDGSAWRAIQAVADVESHMPQFRTVKRPEMFNFNNTIDKGMPLLDEIWNVVDSVA